MQMGTTHRRSAGCVRTRSTSTATVRTHTTLLSNALPTQPGRKPGSPASSATCAQSAPMSATRSDLDTFNSTPRSTFVSEGDPVRVIGANPAHLECGGPRGRRTEPAGAFGLRVQRTSPAGTRPKSSGPGYAGHNTINAPVLGAPAEEALGSADSVTPRIKGALRDGFGDSTASV